jgi:glucose/arabinose dehydrogenase
MKLLSLFLLSSFALLFCACNSVDKNGAEQSAQDSIKLQLITSAVDIPVQVTPVPGNPHSMLITDLSGKIWMLNNDSVNKKPFLSLSTRLEQKDTNYRARAMFSIALHPDFAKNGKLYVCYNAPAKDTADKCMLLISEFSTNGKKDEADTNSERRVFSFECKEVEDLACQIAFGPDGYLYIAIGDHGSPAYVNRAEDLHVYNGKLLRINVNAVPYAIPNDNPFINRKDAKPEIYAYGFRRLWHFSFDPKTSALFGGDVGDIKQEEIDSVEKGGNYGWPEMEGDSIYDTKAKVVPALYAAPINTYSHKEGICVIGGDFYYGNGVPFLRNNYVFADLTGKLFSLSKDDAGKWVRATLKVANPSKESFLICNCNRGYDNELYLSGFYSSKAGVRGAIYKIVKG